MPWFTPSLIRSMDSNREKQQTATQTCAQLGEDDSIKDMLMEAKAHMHAACRTGTENN